MSRRAASSIAVLALLGAAGSGCATITNGTHQKIHIGSIPPGAEAVIDSTERVTTPADIDLARGNPHTVVFHKAGYQDASAELTSGESGMVWGNILYGGLVGAVMDESNGAAKKLSTDDLEVTLTPVATQAAGFTQTVPQATGEVAATVSQQLKSAAQSDKSAEQPSVTPGTEPAAARASQPAPQPPSSQDSNSTRERPGASQDVSPSGAAATAPTVQPATDSKNQ